MFACMRAACIHAPEGVDAETGMQLPGLDCLAVTLHEDYVWRYIAHPMMLTEA